MSAEPALTQRSSLSVRLRNALAATAVVALACTAYVIAPHNHGQMVDDYHLGSFLFSGREFLLLSAAAYVLALWVYYLVEQQPGVSKSLRFFGVVRSFAKEPTTVMRCRLAAEDRVAVLATVLKMFFAPFMVMVLLQHTFGALVNGWAIVMDADWQLGWLEFFNRHGYWFAIKVIFSVDVVVFTVGYLVEMPCLRNEIRSVDPTLLGWMAALVCYPPFNQLTGAILGSSVTDFPKFDDPMTHLVLNGLVLLLMGIYASASAALGLKASNLTHRGIVARGPYALVRHPAYAAKNMAWWIGSIPFVSAAFGKSTAAGATALATVAGWTLIYVLRAVTEEDHLRSVDGDYAAYAARVRHRFIPGVV